MTDVSLFSDDENIELMADKIHNDILTQVEGLSGIKLKKDLVDNGGKNIMEGGILNQLRNKYNNYLEDTKKEYYNLKKKKQSGGGVLTMFVVIIKLILMIFGSYMFNYFPIVMLICLMCVYIEYKLTVTMGHSIIGMPILYMIFACCCPCFWTIFRFFVGWTNKLNVQTGNIWAVLTNCSDPLSILNIYSVNGPVCRSGECFIVNKNCHNVLYPNK